MRTLKRLGSVKAQLCCLLFAALMGANRLGLCSGIPFFLLQTTPSDLSASYGTRPLLLLPVDSGYTLYSGRAASHPCSLTGPLSRCLQERVRCQFILGEDPDRGTFCIPYVHCRFWFA
jgi:hypothetical protein